MGRQRGIWIYLPFEQRPEWKMLDNREFGKNLGDVHFDHALVDLSPTVSDA